MLDFILEGAKRGKGLITALAVYNITVAGGIICNDFFGEKNFFFFSVSQNLYRFLKKSLMGHTHNVRTDSFLLILMFETFGLLKLDLSRMPGSELC
jgi:hypothetical protein